MPTPQPETDEEFVARVTQLNDTAARCAEETIRTAGTYVGEDRAIVLRAVIRRLSAALQETP